MDDPILLEVIEEHESLSVDLICDTFQPSFGQLFHMLRGFSHPLFPPDTMDFEAIDDLEFDQVDDYWGIRNENREVGDDVIVWLFPLVNGIDVYHHHGPFDGLRLSYVVLRNSLDHLPIYLNAITRLTSAFAAKPFYRIRQLDLGSPPDLQIVQADALKIVEYWRKKGIEPGSDDALLLNY
jgi:hypothetical protein